VILGLLLERPSHPYELKRRLSPGLPRERLINDGILYPLLGRLEREGLVEKIEEHARTGRTRHVFHTTQDGRRDFLAWLTDPGADDGRLSYDFLARHPFVKLLFFDELSRDQQLEQLSAAERSTSEVLGLLQADAARSEAPGQLGPALIELLLEQWREELRWLRELRVGMADVHTVPAQERAEPPETGAS
jgi:DNA-binding PadR family transcriptional regulator